VMSTPVELSEAQIAAFTTIFKNNERPVQPLNARTFLVPTTLPVTGGATVTLDGALLEERNLTRAGARLNLTQPAMSAALTRLRQHFGDDLLARSGRQFVLTPAAERILPAVRLALRQVERTFAETGEFDAATSAREFSVAIPGESILALGDLVRRVHALAPAVRVALRPLPTELISDERGLLQHDVLIAPLGFYRPAGQPEVICRDRFVCVADPGNPRLRDGRLTLEDLSALPHAAARLPHAEDDPVQAVL